jgi:hypothetical protein
MFRYFKAPLKDGMKPLSDFLKSYGFSLVAAYSTGEGASEGCCQAYSSEDCDLAFFFANSQLYGTNNFVIGDPGTWETQTDFKFVSLSYYIDNFFGDVSHSMNNSAEGADALVKAFGKQLPVAINLFKQVRERGQWYPEKSERLEAYRNA